MNLSPKERLVFNLIITSFITSTLILLLVILLPIVQQTIIRRAWVPRQTIVSDQPLIGKPSLTASELSVLSPVREDVTLPPAESFYDTGFRPNPDGFSFRNYGTRFPEGNLTIEEVRRLFGDAVCADISGDTCVPTPATHTWIDAMNDYMAAGHCAGFTILSNRLFAGQVEPVSFFPDARITFDVAQNVPTMRQISTDWVLQVTEEVWQARVDGTPRDIIDALLELKRPVDLGIFGRTGGGHSMLAYGVSDQGDGIYHILVYDNNWPGQELYVEVNYRANTWRYSLAATNPAEDAGAWEGDARTRSLMFLPFPAYDQPVTCPFCPADTPDTTSKFMFVTLSGDETMLQASNEQGQQLGHYGDEFVNEIADARLIRLKDAMFNDLEPYLGLPQDKDFTLRLTPRSDQRAAKSNLWSGGPLMAFAIENIKILAGQAVQLGVSPLNQSLTYRVANQSEAVSAVPGEQGDAPVTGDEIPAAVPGNGQTPTIKLAVTHQQKSYLFTVSGMTMLTGDSLTLAVDPQTGQLSLTGQGLENKVVSLTIAELDGDQTNVFVNDQITLGADESSTTFAFTAWAESKNGVLPILTDTDGDGVSDVTAPLTNEPVSELLAGLDSAETIIAVLDELAPYLDPANIPAALEALAALNLDGDDLGEVIFALSEWDLSPAVLADFVAQADLPADELAHFVNELAPDDESLAVWLAVLDLPAETEAEFLNEMQSIEEVDLFLREIEFLNLGEESPEMVAIIMESNLTWDQIGYLLDELNLVIEELIPIITALAPPPDVVNEILHELNLPVDEATLVAAAIDPNQPAVVAANDETAPPATEAATDNPPVTTPAPSVSPTASPVATVTPQPTATTPPTVVPPPPPPSDPDPSPSNGKPVAVNDSAATNENTPVTINALNNDSDPDGDSLRISGVGSPGNGTAALNGIDIVYTPAAGFSGIDTFSYTISDGRDTNTATVTVTVNGRPVAVNDSAVVPENIATTIGVLSNDTDPDGDSLRVNGVGTTGNGTLSISSNSVVYTPNTGFTGADTFTYTITDGSLTDSALVAVTVNGAPTPADDAATTTQGVAVSVDVLSNDTDPESDTLSIQSVNPAGNGVVSVVTGQILYTPNPTFNGLDTFTYFVTDGVQAVSATVAVTVTNINDPPKAVNDLTTTDEDVPVMINVLGNDTDPDADFLSIVATGPAGNGVSTVISGTMVLYTPNANYAGTDVFTYTISDGALTDGASVTVIVNALNDDPPVAVADTATTPQNTLVNISVLANDYDPDNDPLNLTAVGLAANGSASFLTGGTTVFYIPNAGFTGGDVFTYTISDGGLTATGVVTVTVTP